MQTESVLAFSRSEAAEFSGRQVAVAFLVFAVVAAIPIATHALVPLQDYLNHLARMQVIAAIDRDPDLSRFYEVNWQIIPNLIVDVVVPPLTSVMSIYRAGQIFAITAIVLIMSGTLVLNRALFGKWSVLPLLVAPFIYNRVFLLGFLNTTFGLGLAIWGLATWIFLRERPWPWRLLASMLFGVGLFFCHLFTLGFYGLGLLAIELERLWARRDRPLPARVADFLITGLPFVPVLVLLLISPTWGLSKGHEYDLQNKIDGLIAVFKAYSDVVAIGLVATIAGIVILARRGGFLRLHPIGWSVLVIGGIAFLAMPGFVFSAYFVDQRLAISLVPLVIGCVDVELQESADRVWLTALLAAALVIRITEVNVVWTELSRDTAELQKSVMLIERGSRVLVADGDHGDEDEARDAGLYHAASLALIERSALVATEFTIPGKQILQTRPAYRDHVETGDGDLPGIDELQEATNPAASGTDPGDVPYWQLWQKHFDYVYIVFTTKGAANPMPELLTRVYAGNRFQLYRVKRS